MKYNHDYSEEDLENLTDLLLSADENNVLIAIELIKNQGFHRSLFRPLALVANIKACFSKNIENALTKLYKSRIDIPNRALLEQELTLICSYYHFNLSELPEARIQAAIDLIQLFYAPYLKGKTHFLAVLQKIATELWDEGFGAAAEQIYLTCIHLGSLEANTYFELGLYYQNEIAQLEKAKYYYLKSLEIDPNDFVCHNNLGQVFEALNDVVASESHLLAALKLSPNYVHSIINLAYIRWKHQTNFEEAKQLYIQAIAISPYDIYALFNYAELLFQHFKDNKQAIKYLKTIIEMEEEDLNALSLLGDIYLQEGKPKQAIIYYKRGLRHHPTDEHLAKQVELLKLQLG